MREPNDLEQYVAGLYEFDADDFTSLVLRTVILERFTFLEVALNDVLAMRYARDQEAADTLADQVFSRLAMTARIEMLRSILDSEDLTDRWPFLLDVLARLSRLRNALAHGFVERVKEGQFRITTVNRGVVKNLPYTSKELGWLAWQSDVATTELRAIWAVLIPEADDWFGPEPAAD